jgi:APA family basic amino acid/polyamine antiporter
VPLPQALAGGMVAAFFSFGGWWDVSKVAGEVREPERTMPRALVLGVAVVTVAFVGVSAVFLYLVPSEQVTGDSAFATLAGEALFGPAGARVFAGIVILVVLGSLCSILMSQPRVYFAMARDGLFLPALARVHPRLGTPLRAIALEAVLASLLVLWGGNFDTILGLFLFTAVLLIAFSVAALFVLRRRPTGHASSLQTGETPSTDLVGLHDRPVPTAALPPSGHPYSTAFYLLLSAVLLVLMGLNDPLGAGVGVTAAAAGSLAYLFLPPATGSRA